MKTKFALIIICFFTLNATDQEIGLQLYSLRDEFKKDVKGTFKNIKSWGITKVEDGNGGTMGYSLPEFKQILADNNIEIVSASASFEELEENPETIIKRAKDYGSKYVVCFWIPHNDTIFTIKETEKAIAVFNKAGKKLQEKGIQLLYHPHGYEFRPYKDATLMDYMIQQSHYFDFEMDVYWFAHPGQDPITWLRRYPNQSKLMHLKDCKKGTVGNQNGRSDLETNVVLGTGQIDIEAIVKEAQKMGLKYLFIEDESSKSAIQIPKSYQYLKNILD
jgi:sugar phosphate isomerase/epimerase